MKKRVAKALRHKAENETIGKHPDDTRGRYLKLKQEWKAFTKSKVRPVPKLIISKRQQRIKAA